MTNIPKVDDLINKLDTGWYKKSIFYQFLSLKYIDFSSIHFYQYTSNRNAFLAERIPIGVYVFFANSLFCGTKVSLYRNLMWDMKL